MNMLVQKYEEAVISQIQADSERARPSFRPGDNLRVHVRVIEGKRERIQMFEGVCIARRNAGLHSSFTVRKLSFGEGVERVFPLYSPRVAKIEVVRHGRVRRAKLFYLRGRTGKKARITERTSYGKDTAVSNKSAAKPPAVADSLEKKSTTDSSDT